MNFPGFSKAKDYLRQPELSLKCNIGIVGAKGGVGATTVAVNLAHVLSKEALPGEKTTLIDCNLQQPDAALMLSCHPEHSIVELFLRSESLDTQTVDACSLPLDFSTSMRLITPPLDGNAALNFSLTDIAGCLPVISEHSRVNVLDIPNRLDKHLVNILDACNLIVLVIEPNMTSIAAGKRWLKNFAELGYKENNLMIVINRVGGKLKYIEQQASKSFAGVELFNLPSVYSQAENCAIEGLPLTLKAPKDAYCKVMQNLAVAMKERILLMQNQSAENLTLQNV